jgi:hypothetical protein
MRTENLLTNEMLKSGAISKAQFIFFAEGGAMGQAGKILLVQKNGELYAGNYVYGDLSVDLIIKKFPYLSADKFDKLMEHGVSDDGKIHYYYLECGNHLFVRDAVHETFRDMTRECKYCEDYGAAWFNAACGICPDKNRKDMLNEVEMYCKELKMKPPKGYPYAITDDELAQWVEVWSEYDPVPELK